MKRVVDIESQLGQEECLSVCLGVEPYGEVVKTKEEGLHSLLLS